MVRMLWRGRRTLSGGYFDGGRFTVAWRGWKRPRLKSSKIGTATLYMVGPLAIIVKAKGWRRWEPTYLRDGSK